MADYIYRLVEIAGSSKAICPKCGVPGPWRWVLATNTTTTRNVWMLASDAAVADFRVGKEFPGYAIKAHHCDGAGGGMTRQQAIKVAHAKFSAEHGHTLDAAAVMRSTKPMLLEYIRTGDLNAIKVNKLGQPIFEAEHVVTEKTEKADENTPPTPAIDVDSIVELISERFESRIADMINEMRPQTIEVVKYDGTKKDLGRQHPMFPYLLQMIGLRLPIWLKGPASSGKTYAAEMAAIALDLPYTQVSMSMQTSEAKLMGFSDAQGRYVPGVLYAAFKNGGVLAIDEIDRSNPNVLITLNAAAACSPGQSLTFPAGRDEDGNTVMVQIKRHEDFVLVASANTYGTGADSEYVGAAKIDAATLDRFNFLQWDIDEKLERDLANQYGDMNEWVDFVQRLRRARGNVKFVVSMRVTLDGARMLAGGMDREFVENARIWHKMSADEAMQIRSRLGGA